MPLVTIEQFAYVKGTLGNVMSNRSDLDTYRYGGLDFTNYNLLPQGPMQKRRGFKHLASATDVIRIFTFKFSDTQEYIMAFKDQEIDVYTADDNVYRATITTPWTASEVPQVKWTQSFDTLIMSHENYPTKRIVRSSDTVWNISDFLFEDPPVDRFNVSDDLTPSATSGSITLTLTGSGYWEAGHVGVLIRTNEGAAEITSITSPTVAQATVTENLLNTNVDSAWREEVFSAVHGYARVPIFYASRLIFCGSRDLPQSLWASKTGDIDNFNAEDLADDFGFAGTLSSGISEPIYDAIVRGSGTDANLQIYTASSEWVLEGQPLTPSTANPKVQTRIGSLQRPRPLEVSDQTIFCSKDGKSIFDFEYDFGTNSFNNTNLTILAPNVINTPKDTAYLRNYKTTQADMLYVLNTDGTLSVLTINKNREVLGWSTYSTEGTIVSLCVADGTLKLIVTRDNGTYLEEMTEDDVWLDSFEVLSGSAQTSWGPVAHMANQTITVMIDGFPDEVTLDGSGNFTTANAADEVIVGYNYTSRYESMPLVFAIQGLNRRGERIRKVKAVITVTETKDLVVDGFQVPTRRLGANLLDKPIPSLEIPVTVRLSGISGSPTFVIESTLPFPQTVVGTILTLKG